MDLRCDFGGQAGVYRLERTAGRLGQHLCRTGAFQEKEIVVGVVQAFSAHHDSVIGKKYDVGALHGMRDAFPFADVQRQPVVVFVDGQTAMETHGVLREGGVQTTIGSER
ncbi:hypothetical protein D3C72_1764540 [compost metagenome]